MRPFGPFGRLALFVLGRRRATVVVVVLVSLVAAVLGLPPAINTDTLALLPEDHPEVAALAALDVEEGGANLLTLAFTGEDEALSETLTELEGRLAALPSVRYALHDLDPELARRIALLQLEPAEVHELAGRVRGALALGPALNPIVTQRLMDMGPLGDRIQASSTQPEWLGVHDGHGRLIVRPTGSSHDQVFSQHLMDEVQALLDDAELADHGITLTWMGGAYRHNVEDVAAVRRDVAVTSMASAAMVLLVLLFAFRRPRSVVMVFVPLVVANVVNFAVVRFAIGAVNTYTSFGTAILIGLGIDFAVHLVYRYREERFRGRPMEEAIAVAWDRAGPPCSTAALTSAAGFVALGVAEFRGFSQLGLVLGTGLIICLIAMLVCLPILIAVLERDPPAPLGAPSVLSTPSASSYRLAPLGLMVFVLMTAFTGVTRLRHIGFEYDISAIRTDGMAYNELTEEERLIVKDSYAPVVVTYKTASALRTAHRRLVREQEAGLLPHVARVVSIESVLPPDQGARLAELADLAALIDNPSARYLPPPIARALLSLRGASLQPLHRADLPAALLGLLGADQPSAHRLLLMPQGNMWDMREAEALAGELEAALPNETPASEQLILADLFRLVRRDMPIVGVLAMLLVAALTAIDLRSPPRIVGALGALLAGMIWSGAAVEWVGVKLSMLNVVGIPILLGIGVDVVIHLMHRLGEEGPGGVRRALRTTGVAAGVSALTTVLSFASLWLGSNRGIRSLGTLVVIGLTTVVVCAAVVLPLAWAAGWRMTGRAPSQETPRRAPSRRHEANEPPDA